MPKVVVLLATWNGMKWLQEQVGSILAQRGVSVRIIASDDQSTDGTHELLQSMADAGQLTLLPRASERFRNANRNFLRLIKDAQVASDEYVSFADQDDIWLPEKLSLAVTTIDRRSLDVYSSDVMAFWPDGRRKALNKGGPLRHFDHLFESAGPGCSFVYTPSAYGNLASWVRARHARLVQCKVHDWLLYAHAREVGQRWYIDDATPLLYRQHASNEVGANSGLKAASHRFRQIRSGSYRLQILDVADAVGHRSWVRDALERFGVTDRLKLALSSLQFRRRPRDAALMAVFFLLMGRGG